MRKNYIKPQAKTVNLGMHQIISTSKSGTIVEGDTKNQLGKEDNDGTDEGFDW